MTDGDQRAPASVPGSFGAGERSAHFDGLNDRGASRHDGLPSSIVKGRGTQ